jgi:NAD(P)-dependent dehydrogenase (short-subunit alcohol dehydrogenase family)
MNFDIPATPSSQPLTFGFGKATAAALAEAGMDVDVTWHSDSKGADATAEEVRSKGRNAVVLQLD